MNVLLLAEVSIAEVIGGAERVLREQALGLKARGHTVRVLTRMPVTAGMPQIEVEGATEYRYEVIGSSTVSFFLSSVRNARRARVTLERGWLPDVVAVHQALPGLAYLGWAQRAPLVYVCLSLAHEEFETRDRVPADAMGKIWHRAQSLIRRWTERVLIRRAQRVVVLSEFMRRRLVDCHRVNAERIRLVPGAVDAEVFAPCTDRRPIRASLGLAEEEFVLFTVRNLQPRMGLDALVHAMARLKREIPRIRLLIGGSGPLRASLESQVMRLGLDGCIRLVGFVPEDRLPDYYRAADLFVLPTAQLEGFGLVTVEALACGTPVFATPVGATEEILGNLDRSLLAEGTDADALAKGIAALYRRLAAEPAVRERLARAGRALVLREYTWSRHCANLEGVLSEAIQSRSVARP